ncbi:MAG: hypothetical protein ACJA2S_005376, partial [Cyclobacteriaceae bacterium]
KSESEIIGIEQLITNQIITVQKYFKLIQSLYFKPFNTFLILEWKFFSYEETLYDRSTFDLCFSFNVGCD